MIFQVKYKNIKRKLALSGRSESKGFSLIEFLIVLAIIGIFVTISTSVYYNFQTENNLTLAVNNTVEALRYVQKKSEIGSSDAVWGVRINTNNIEILKNSSVEETKSLPKGVTVTGLSEINFNKLTGKTSNTGIIIFTNNFGVKNININSNGTISY